MGIEPNAPGRLARLIIAELGLDPSQIDADASIVATASTTGDRYEITWSGRAYLPVARVEELLATAYREALPEPHNTDQDIGRVTSLRCGLCGRQRTIHDAYDYNPLQVVTGRPVGWYSGTDGELCPECMATTLNDHRSPL